jgi:tRNA threonylcarbamoyladenosine biosynthesis protein TsaB
MILALKTADFTTCIWLYADPDSDKPVAQLEWESGRELSEQLLGRIVNFLETENLTIKDLTGILIFSGPGSFTSLRIGHTTVNALADSLSIPAVGAMGEHWLSAGRFQLEHARPGRPVLPHYGSEAHITKPKS